MNIASMHLLPLLDLITTENTAYIHTFFMAEQLLAQVLLLQTLNTGLQTHFFGASDFLQCLEN
jgi:hypothetical protein